MDSHRIALCDGNCHAILVTDTYVHPGYSNGLTVAVSISHFIHPITQHDADRDVDRISDAIKRALSDAGLSAR